MKKYLLSLAFLSTFATGAFAAENVETILNATADHHHHYWHCTAYDSHHHGFSGVRDIHYSHAYNSAVRACYSRTRDHHCYHDVHCHQD